MTDALIKRPQIDGLRALAMIGVLYVHYWNKAPVTEYVRVTLFFVISGFLITHILMNAKARGGHILVRNFYIRRALRLFPALIVCFAAAWVCFPRAFGHRFHEHSATRSTMIRPLIPR